MNCNGGKYAFGGPPKDETLGDGKLTLNWLPYTTPVDMGDKEFAYAECGEQKEGVLTLDPQQAPKDRTSQITSSLASYLNVTPRPLTVFVIMFDSVSRFHFYRNFKQTFDFLNQELVQGKYKETIVGYDFVINNVHGINTQPNVAAIFWGHDLAVHNQLAKGLKFNLTAHEPQWSKIQESAIWKVLESHGFVTMFTYDTTWDFVVKSTGHKINTDHRAFNFWKGAFSVFRYREEIEDQRCFGTKDSHTYMYDYSVEFVKAYEGFNRFAYLHLSPGHEKTGNVIRTADKDTKVLLEQLFEHIHTHQQEDFVVFLTSDHGIQQEQWKETNAGYKENQLPGFFLFANQQFINRMDIHETLTTNTQRLIGRYDWHWMFRHLATAPYGRVQPNSPVTKYWAKTLDKEEPQSPLLQAYPKDRTCSMLEIPSFLCSCIDYKDIPISEAAKSEVINLITRQGFQHINAQNRKDAATSVCQELSFKSLSFVHETMLKDDDNYNRNYRVRVKANEGQEVYFDFLAFVASKRKQPKSFIDKEPDVFPIGAATVSIPGIQPFKANVQVRKAMRIDRYEGLCEQLARTIGSTAAYCLCRDPVTYTEAELKANSVLTNAYEALLSKLVITVADEGTNCQEFCQRINRSCFEWGAQLLGSKNTIEQVWRSNPTYTIRFDNQAVSPRDLTNEKRVESGTILGVTDSVITLGDFAKPDCASVVKGVRGLCPCG